MFIVFNTMPLSSKIPLVTNLDYISLNASTSGIHNHLSAAWLVFYKEVASPFNFHLEQYDGPLDLLLDLIRKQQINIYDIPIASITQQYLEYMQRAMELDIELSSEFVYMAATLIHIKSRMLLPKDPELEKISPEEDPRQELVDRSARTRALQERSGDAAAEAHGGRRFLVEPADGAVSGRERRAGIGRFALRPGENAADRPGARQEPAHLRSRQRGRQHPRHDSLSGARLRRASDRRVAFQPPSCSSGRAAAAR